MRIAWALAIAFLSACVAFGSPNTTLEPKYRDSELLIKFRQGATEQEIAKFEQEFSLTKLKRFAGIGVHQYRLPAKLRVKDTAGSLSTNPLVSFAEPNFFRKPFAYDSPNTNQWYLRNTGQRVNGATGPPGNDINWIAGINQFTTGNSVTVAVVDTGVALNHSDLLPNLWVNPSETLNGRDDDGNGYIDDILGYDFLDNDPDPYDEFGHGSLVAGIIGAVADNGLGIVGVCPRAKMMSLRIADEFGLITVADEIPALDYARRKGAKVVNCSFGGVGYSSSERAAIEALRDGGILVVCAAGNAGANIDQTPVYPASYNLANMITVAATDRTLGLASFSNYGAKSVHVAAPGTDMFSTTLTRIRVFPIGSQIIPSAWTSGGVSGGYRWTFVTSGVNTYLSDGSISAANGDAEPYTPGTDTWMQSPKISLASAVGSQLSLSAVYDLADDFISVETSSDGVSWATVGFIEGTSDGESQDLDFDLSSSDGKNLYVRFHLVSNDSDQGTGISISDIRITRVSVLADGQSADYEFNQGTSFAAPIVSGVAALALAQRPDLNYAQVKNLILSQTRPVAALAGSVASAGIVDAGKVMTALASIPISNAPPVITSQPVSQRVTSGDAVTFRVAAMGAAPLSYQWSFNGQPIKAATDASYNIVNVQLAQAGNYSAVVSNSFGTTTSASASLTVDGASALGIVGAPFVFQIAANNSPTWFTASGLPPGLTCNGQNGLISGIPTAAGTFQVHVEARNIFTSASGTIVIVIKPGAITSSTVASGIVGARFFYLITANNAPTWTTASGLPPGLTLSGSTGLIVGTPTGAGTYHVIVEAKNLFGSASATITITIHTGSITSPSTVSGVLGVPLAYLTTANNEPTWFSASGLPPGLKISGSTGLISGLPTAAGTYEVRVEARNIFDSALGTITFVIENPFITGGTGSTSSQPLLAIAPAGANLVLSWPATNSDGFVLEEAQLQQGTWSNSSAPVVIRGDQNTASIPAQGAARFYRLRKLSQ